jgi:hypothetical protein
VRFGPWYRLADAAHEAPGSAGVLQIRLAHGLRDYPRGKSAMVAYAVAADVRAAATELARLHAGRDLVCRHLIEIDDGVDLAAFHAKLVADFVRRFGAEPTS